MHVVDRQQRHTPINITSVIYFFFGLWVNVSETVCVIVVGAIYVRASVNYAFILYGLGHKCIISL